RAPFRALLARKHVGEEFDRIAQLLAADAQLMALPRRELAQGLAALLDLPPATRKLVGGKCRDGLLAPQLAQIVVVPGPWAGFQPLRRIQHQRAKPLRADRVGGRVVRPPSPRLDGAA